MFKNSLLIGLTLSLSLALTGCGGSPPPTATDMSSMSSMSSGISPITATGDGAITPVGDLSAGDAYDQSYQEPAGEETPAEEVPAEEAPAEDAAAATPTATGSAPSTMPADMTVAEPYKPATTGSTGSSAPAYAAEGSFKVDQDTFNQWQAVNVASDGVNVYVAAVDSKMPAKGTVITMDSAGANWKDIGKSFLATITLGAAGYKMDKTITGVALDSSGNVLVADAADRVFTLTAPKFSITEVDVAISGATDVVNAGSNYFVATSAGIQKLDSGLSAPSSFGSVTPTGGLGADAQGNVYAVVGSAIQKLSATGTAAEVVKGLSAPLDVAVDSSGNIFVLESSSVVWFNAKGVKQGEFGSGELQAPKALCTDSSGAVYVADAGSSHKDSVVVKFVAGSASGGGLDSSLDTL